MKKLTVLLTSLLLAGAASATVLDFEGVETHQNTSINLNQDFQVAHLCGLGRVHVGGGHNHSWNNWGHELPRVQCARKDWIWHCLSQNKPLDVTRGGFTCVEHKCPIGYKVDTSENLVRVYQCVHAGCPANHSWQSAQQKCVAFSELNNYCKTLGKIYNSTLDKCEGECPEGQDWQEVHNKCISIDELNAYCRREAGTGYDPVRNRCR